MSTIAIATAEQKIRSVACGARFAMDVWKSPKDLQNDLQAIVAALDAARTQAQEAEDRARFLARGTDALGTEIAMAIKRWQGLH